MTQAYASLSALLSEYGHHQAAANRSLRTIELSRNYTQRLIDWLEAKNYTTAVSGITTGILREYFAELTSTVSGTTAGIHYRTLRAVFNWIELEEEIPSSPFKRLTEPKADVKPVPIYTDDELKALLKVTAGASFENRRDRAMIFVLLDSGVRLGELLSMTTQELHWLGGGDDKAACVMLVEGKTGKRSAAVRSPDALLALRKYTRVREGHDFGKASDVLWVGKRGPLTESGVAQILKRRGKDAGVEGVRPHRFRHTFAHREKLLGRSDEEIMEGGGWKSPEMMKRYGASAAFERFLSRDIGSAADGLV